MDVPDPEAAAPPPARSVTSLPLVRLGPTRVRVHASLVIVMALLTVMLATSLFPQQTGTATYSTVEYWMLGIAGALAFLVSIFVHEVAHLVVMRLQGSAPQELILFAHAGHATGAEEPETAWREFALASSGPIVTLVLGGAGLWMAHALGDIRYLGLIAQFFGTANVLLGLAHLVPGFPLDGGRILRSVAWGLAGQKNRGTRWAARVAMAFALLLGATGIVMTARSGWSAWTWAAILALPLWMQAVIASRAASQGERLQGLVVADLMEPPPAALSRVLSVEDALAELARAARPFEGYLVEFSGRLGGIVGMTALRLVPPEERLQTPVGQVTTRLARQHVMSPRTRLERAVTRMVTERLPILPVVHDGVVVGILRWESIARYVAAPAGTRPS